MEEYADILPSYNPSDYSLYATDPEDAKTEAARMATRKRAAPEASVVTSDRLIDRMPLTVEKAAEEERRLGWRKGTYFVGLCRRRLVGMVEMQRKWMVRSKNKNSDYLEIQAELSGWLAGAIAKFDEDYANKYNYKDDSTIKVREKKK